ncbi:cytochrome P450 [Nocardiopsis sp. RSe5-2]|uniref:Cytochrome P450 n=1 Tax=Nocardiopsis endophytica TaxID=3018445 RepID=A0ABT4UB82_9ACTN|nr:cytochrome P450 [Nocardiopsis endophytica]MDA2813724.1 cytochrome P450 [Nocardiopsis endophytica]
MPDAAAFPFPSDHPLTPAPALAEARKGGAPVRVRLPFGDPAWLVTRYEDAKDVLSSPRFGRDAERAGIPEERTARIGPIDVSNRTIMNMDPPRHTQVRGLVGKVFTPRRVERLRPWTRGVADRLVQGMRDQGPPGDLVRDLALPLPIEVICELLGVPSSDRHSFHAWSDAFLSTTDSTPERVQENQARIDAYLADMVTLRRDDPDGGLVGALAREHYEGSRLNEEELLGLLRALLIAGHETTASLVPGFFYLLLKEDGFARLVTDPGLVPGAVEELLRLVPLIRPGSFTRYALEDAEVGGVRVPAGDQVIVELSAANRDPEAFAEPDRLDFERGRTPHLAFGHGIHHCVGASLARMELQVALEAMAEGLPGLRPATPLEELRWNEERFVRSTEAFPVTW